MLGCLALVVGCAASAQAAGDKFYFALDAGANIMQDPDLTVEAPGVSGVHWPEEADLGWRMGFTAGYSLSSMLGVQVETGYIYSPFPGDVQMDQLPLLGNVVFRYQTPAKIIPYVGVGAGGVFSILTIDEYPVSDDENNMVFGWQAKAGVLYQFNDKLSLGIGYKYLGTLGRNYEFAEDLNIDFGNIHTHCVGLVLEGRF